MTIFKDRIKYNSFLFAFFIFLYGLCTVTDLFVNMQLMIAITIIIAIIPAIFLNIMNQRWKLYATILLFLLLFLFQLVLYPSQNEAIISTMISFSTIGVVGLYIGSNEVDYRLIYKYGLKLAYLNFVLVTIFLVFKQIDIDFSMRFGYAMLPSTIWFYFQVIKEKKIGYLVLFFSSLSMLILWGSRGTLLVLMILLFLQVLRKSVYLTMSAITILLLFYNKIIDIFVAVMEKLPFDTFKSRKLVAMLTNDFWDNSSGRDIIYGYCIDLIKNNLQGLGIGFWQNDSNMFNLYPHNIFLQIGCEFGFLGLILIFAIMVILLKKIYKTKNSTEFNLLIILFSISFGRLVVSSEYWSRPEFWLLLSVVLIKKTKKNE